MIHYTPYLDSDAGWCRGQLRPCNRVSSHSVFVKGSNVLLCYLTRHIQSSCTILVSSFPQIVVHEIGTKQLSDTLPGNRLTSVLIEKDRETAFLSSKDPYKPPYHHKVQVCKGRTSNVHFIYQMYWDYNETSTKYGKKILNIILQQPLKDICSWRFITNWRGAARGES